MPMLLSCTTIKYKAPEIDHSLFDECPHYLIEVEPIILEKCDKNDLSACKQIIYSLIDTSFKLNQSIERCNYDKQQIKEILDKLGD